MSFEEDFISHFGVKGMRWGTHKTPAQIKAERNLKAKKYEDKAAEIQKQIDKKRGKRFSKTAIIGLEEKKRIALIDAEKKRKGKLSTRQKKVAIGAAVVGALAVSYVAYSSLSSGNARRLASKGSDFIKNRKGPNWKFNSKLADKSLSSEEIMDTVVSKINPGYGKPGSVNNCRRATFAYEMRRRGYDVSATLTPNGRGQDASGLFNAISPSENIVPSGRLGMAQRLVRESKKGGSFSRFLEKSPSGLGKHTFGSLTETAHHFDSLPDRSRGELGVKWASGGAHSMVWEKINGKMYIIDAQRNLKWSLSEFSSSKEASMLAEISITRLDDVDLNVDFLRRWLKSA